MATQQKKIASALTIGEVRSKDFNKPKPEGKTYTFQEEFKVQGGIATVPKGATAHECNDGAYAIANNGDRLFFRLGSLRIEQLLKDKIIS